MKTLIAMLVLVLNYSFVIAQTNQNTLLTAKTEPPVLPDKIGGGQFQGLTEDLYKTFPAQMWENPNYIRIKRKPKRLSADARFGINLLVNGKNIGWIIDGNATRGYTLYADWNADGDLSNDAPVNFKKTGETYTYRKTLVETNSNQKRKYPFNLKLEITEVALPNGTGKTLALKADSTTTRRGVLNVDNRRIAFNLAGRDGFYNSDYDYLYFDLNGDGKFDTETRYSPESYKVPEKHINIGDTTYEFTVDRYGNSLTLKPLAEKLPARAELSIGNQAPEFSFKDIDGKQHRLSDFRGKTVLLDFWGVWCAPCIVEAPNLAAVYKRLKGKGFEVIGLDTRDTPEVLRKFITEKQMNWTHLQADDALLQLYRVDRYPTYFLLDKEGKIISNTTRAGKEMYKKVEEMLSN